MTRIASALGFAAVLLSASCSRTTMAGAGASAPRPAVAEASGAVVFEPDSPLLKEIVRASVREQQLPSDEIVAPGKIEANPTRLSKIVPPVTGRIGKVFVSIGDTVRAGQPLFTIQSPDADAATSAYLSAQAALTQAQATSGKAQADFDRETDLFAHDAVAKKDVLAADSALSQAKAGADQARASLEQTRRHLGVLGLKEGDFRQDVVVSAPFGGKVLDVALVAGEYRTDQTLPAVTVADLSSVWVTSQVPESYIRFVQIGERVEISLIAYPGETFEGRVSRIADTVDPQTRTVKVQAEVDNRSGRFRPEMYGSIHHVGSIVAMPVVPPGAVVQSDGRTMVYVETAPGRFAPREITVGAPAGDVVRVTRGLSAGERIVVDGTMLVKGLAGRRAGA
jgi:cobalt-zinc-cadmium efflux system membrane fusion protein